MGYPGDPNYREFYRDVGFDLDKEYVRPYIQPTGDRKNTGIKYYRITGKVPLSAKEPYNRGWRRSVQLIHAGNFVYNRERQIENLAQGLGRPPIVVSPYDAELYGHWWYEGPDFLEAYIRKATLTTGPTSCRPIDYLAEMPEAARCRPANSMSSWGRESYAISSIHRTTGSANLHKCAGTDDPCLARD